MTSRKASTPAQRGAARSAADPADAALAALREAVRAAHETMHGIRQERAAAISAIENAAERHARELIELHQKMMDQLEAAGTSMIEQVREIGDCASAEEFAALLIRSCREVMAAELIEAQSIVVREIRSAGRKLAAVACDQDVDLARLFGAEILTGVLRHGQSLAAGRVSRPGTQGMRVTEG